MEGHGTLISANAAEAKFGFELLLSLRRAWYMLNFYPQAEVRLLRYARPI
jgi:hypothetical protein